MTTISASISLIEHLLTIPKTPDENAGEFETKPLDFQPRTINLGDSSNNCFVDKSTLNT